ncbi:hypothetical protein ACIQNU_05235 [Streptomyces sp. NPDC091292]|uniref:hypothetical protein n=1 Tax=Streptomyces sp. NPDC091292 TaxID=3365991 RepID=UPI0037FECE28
MKDQEILAGFNGQGTAEFTLRGPDVAQSDRITAIGFELGYDLREAICVTRGQWRMIYVRNDSPEVRLRVQGAVERMRAGGPLLPQVWGAVGAPHGGRRLITATEAASARRSITAYETHGATSVVVLVALLSLGCFVLVWVRRDVPGPAVGLAVVGAALAATALLTPRLMKRWYERNRQTVARFEQARNQQWGPPPPPPGKGTHPDQRGEGS